VDSPPATALHWTCGSYIGPDALGHFRGYPQIHQPGRAARNPELARRLWDVAATLTRITTGKR
jgi:hypothetical protein